MLNRKIDTTANSLFWSIIEVNIALICASCPAIRTIFTRHQIPLISHFLCCGGGSNGSDPECAGKYNRTSYAARNCWSPAENPYEAGLGDLGDLEAAAGSEVGSVRELEVMGRDIKTDVEKGVEEVIDVEMPKEPEKVKSP